MAVFRVEKTRDYTVMANHHLKNRSLSLKAKGLLSIMLSLPESWDYTLKGLSLITKEGVDAIREAIRELERTGYILRSRERNEQGHLKGSEYLIYEQPHLPDESPIPDYPALELPTLEEPILENPTLENPAQDKPTLGNPTQLSTYRTNINPESKKESNSQQANPYPSNPYLSNDDARKSMVMDVSKLRKQVQNRISYDCIVNSINRERLDEIVELIVETLCSTKPFITVAGEEYAAELVKERMMQINSLHVEYIFSCLEKSSPDIHNIKRYLLATLFNAPVTMSSYYDALVRSDQKKWAGW